MSIRKRILSFKFAIEGIADLFRSEPNAWIHLIMTIVTIIGACYFNISTTEWCFCILAIAFVLCAEAMNTAIEHLTDLVSPDYHALAKRTKDVAAGAVLFAAIAAATIGFIIFLPKILALF